MVHAFQDVSTHAVACNHQLPIPYQQFQSGELVNHLELMVIDLIQMCLGDRFHYFAEYPLEKICQRPTHYWLDKDDWKFLVNSRVDIAMMERNFGTNRKASLVVECQSWYHDNPEAQDRDRRKAQLLAIVGVPLIYVRRVAQDQRFYRFYTSDATEEVFYNIVTQDNREQLKSFLKKHQKQ